MKTSRTVLLPLLAVGLGVAIWLGSRLAGNSGAEGGWGAIVAEGSGTAETPAADDLRAPARDPAALQAAEPDAGLPGVAAADDESAAPEATHAVHGTVILLDGGELPSQLAVHASRRRPYPYLTNMRGMINDRGEDVIMQPGGSWPTQEQRDALGQATRAEVAADLTFTMVAVPESGAFVVVEDSQLYADPAARIARGADSVEVRLHRGGSISGRVTAADGAPLAGATVSGGTPFDPFMVFDTAARMVQLDEAKTDADGRYTLAQVPAGKELVLAAGLRDGGVQSTRAEVAALLPGEVRSVDLQLRPASTIAGHVLTPEGAPVPDARVRLQRTDFNMKEVSLAGRGIDGGDLQEDSDASGAFRFDGVADGSYEVLLTEDGFRMTRVAVPKVTAGQAVADIELLAEAGLPVSGSVLDGAGLPVAKAKVKGFLPPSIMDMSSNLDRELRPSVETDEQGHFALSGFDPGKIRVRATADGFQAAHVDAQAGDTGVILTLQPTRELSGIVVSLTDGEPVTQFKVGLLPDGGLFDMSDPFGIAERMEGARRGESFRDRSDGRFTLTEVKPGDYDLSVSAAGFGTVTMEHVEVGTEGRKGLVVMLPPEASVSGVVVDGKTGRAVEGATIDTVRGSMIENMANGMLDERPHAVTGADGRFRLGGLSMEPVKLNVAHQEYKDLGLAELVLGPGEQRDVGVLALASGGAIFGRVLDALGRGVPGIQVMVSEATGRSFKRASTDERGGYRVGGLPAGTYNVMRMDFTMNMGGDAGPMDFLKDMVFEAVTLAADQEREVNLTAKTAGGTRLYGDVLAAGGAVNGALVTLIPEDGPMSSLAFTNTNKDGRYELAGVKPGSYALQVMVLDSMAMASGGPASSPAIETLTVSGAEQRHDVRLPGGTLHGSVESTVDGSHVPGVRVLLERTDDGLPKVGLLKATGGRVAEGYTDTAGGFSFHYLPEGTFTVVAGGRNAVGMGAAGWAVTRLPDLHVTAGGPGFSVHVKVAPAGGIAGRVTDGSGTALSGVSLWFMDPKGQWLSTFSEQTTDNGGTYEVNSLAPGLWTVAFRDGSHALQLVPDVNVRKGEITPLDATLRPGVALHLATADHDPWSLQILLDGPDGALPTGLVSLDQLMGDEDSAPVTRLGIFEPGPYHLKVMAAGNTLLDTTVVLVAGSGAKLVTLGS